MTPQTPTNRALNVHLGPLKEPWTAYCAARGLKPGAAIREAIAHQLKSADGTGQATNAGRKSQSDEQPDTGQKERVRVWLTPSEKDAIRAHANAEQTTVARWVIDAIRTRLTHEPQFSTREIEVLGESNFQLLSIGRNINQIARRLNEGGQVPEIATAIKELRRQIADHTADVDRAMRASIERWRIE